MGKLKGIIQLTGKFDGLSFYEMNGKIVIRKTGGFDGEKIKNSSNYARVRENSTEFAHCAKVGKYFRSAFSSCLMPLRIPYVHNHIVSLFQGILKLDGIQKEEIELLEMECLLRKVKRRFWLLNLIKLKSLVVTFLLKWRLILLLVV